MHLPIGGHRVSQLASLESTVREWIAQAPDLTLSELRERLEHEAQLTLKEGAIWHQLNRWGLSYKKILHASEQARPDVADARERWEQTRKVWSPEQLVFLDETGVSTNMVRLRGRAPKGERCLAHAPYGHWHTNTFVAALRHDGLTAPWLINGAMNGETFLAYVHTQLAPTLRRDDLVIADNLSSHKVSGVAKPSR